MPPDPQTALRERFGFDAFRPGQQEAVEAAVGGRDVLVVMPTGAGKSLCYQLPALMRDDLTIVVSPLVSLMQDQVEALERVASGEVALVNAQQDAATNARALESARLGQLRLLYVAPERFASPAFLQGIAGVRVGLFVVDEAHCVSQWGHDFRPDYFRLADAARWLEADAIVASTATATKQVARDVVERLGLRDPVRVTTGFDRPNLTFAVVPCATGKVKEARIAAALADPSSRPAIVYAGTRNGTDRLARSLATSLGVAVEAYHAGLPRDERAAVQRRFMGGETPVVVATNAFGMGVDKADVRTVCHESVPGSLEAYYQEAGRAGRDGAPSRALLFAENKDKGLHVFFIERAKVDEAQVEAVARRLVSSAVDGRYDLAVDDVASGRDGADSARAVVGHLVRAEVVRPAPSPPDRLRGRVLKAFDGAARATVRRSAGEAERGRWSQYRSIWGFVESQTCRRAAILEHFGDPAPPVTDEGVPCCDRCDPQGAVPAAVQEAGPVKAWRGPSRGGGTSGGSTPKAGSTEDLEDAILATVGSAQPAVGRTRTVEILRGGRAKLIAQNGYDGLPTYSAFAHLTQKEVLGRVDALLEEGRLRSTGGAYPKLALGDGAREGAAPRLTPPEAAPAPRRGTRVARAGVGRPTPSGAVADLNRDMSGSDRPPSLDDPFADDAPPPLDESFAPPEAFEDDPAAA